MEQADILMHFFDETTEGEIPNSLGIYAFYLNMIDPAKIGLAGPGPFDSRLLLAARERLVSRLSQQLLLIHEMKLEGEISEPKPGSHLRRTFTVHASSQQYDVALDEARDVRLTELREYAHVLSKCMSLAKPIYVGITAGQSFKQRYLQHKSDFYRNPIVEGTFGSRFAVAGGTWDDLVFACIEVSSDLFSGNSLSRIERLVQSLTHPTYSLR
ncbi:hypothetical protein [Burkholderia ubonensis]|uniref:hypothetical protein n=1 Tax=Burkholderia ubonensis TaxID=101571 RepID=UPI0012F91FB6|nr:hypothetical protein [Burkholderia ubonensis]